MLIGIPIAACALFVAFTGWMGNTVMDGATNLTTPEGTQGVRIDPAVIEATGFDYDAFRESHRIERIEVSSSLDGHAIPGDLIFAPGADRNNKTVIMAHCDNGNRTTNYPQAEMFTNLGYNVLTFDQRNSNESVAERNTFGYLEKYDLIDLIDYVRRQSPSSEVGVWGSSMGGATAIQAVGFEDTSDKMNWLILECPVSEMRWMVDEAMRQMDTGLPVAYMSAAGNLALKARLGFSYDDANGVEAARNVSVPTLVICSTIDDTTPYFMGEGIYDALPDGKKSLWALDDCGHIEMWAAHHDEYVRRVMDFLASQR